MSDGVIHAQFQPLSDDLSFCQILQRCADVKSPVFVDSFRSECRGEFKRFDECRTAVGIPGVVQTVDSDINGFCPDGFRQSCGEGEKNRISCRDVSDGYFFIIQFCDLSI